MTTAIEADLADCNDIARPSTGTAKVFHVPGDRIVSVEHPCIVKDIDKGVKSLGGEAQVKNVGRSRWQHFIFPLSDHSRSQLVQSSGKVPVAIVSLRPNDPFAKKLTGRQVRVSNLLLRVTLPARTGRKRKRGSGDPFTLTGNPSDLGDDVLQTPPVEPPLNCQTMLQRLKDSQGGYRIQPLGALNETHRFRALPDFQMSASDIPVMRNIANHLLQPTCKTFSRPLGA